MDLGSNTFHVLSADVRNGTVVPLADAKVAVRMGERAFLDGKFSNDAFERGLAAIEQLLEPLDGRRPITVATGVFREASNANVFLAEVRRRFDLDVRVISGYEEAELTYRAVCAEVVDPEVRIAVFDLGGGSLECIFGEAGRVELARSLPLGALRLAARLEAGDLCGPVRALVMANASRVLDEIRRREPEVVVLSSGTARTLLRVAQAMGRTEPVVNCLGAPTVAALATRLTRATDIDLASLGVPASRFDTIGVGALVFSTIVRELRVPYVRVAKGALREGLALRASEPASRYSHRMFTASIAV